MKSYLNKTPEGTRDLLFEECIARRQVEDHLAALFRSCGYNQVVTPSVEYYNVFSQGSSGLQEEDMYKLTDANGRLIVLRPDNTLPIARVVSGRLKEAALPLRLFYCQNIFRRHMLMAGHSDECEQCGVELIGAGGYRADLEILTLAVQALENVSTEGYKSRSDTPDFITRCVTCSIQTRKSGRRSAALLKRKITLRCAICSIRFRIQRPLRL